MVGKLINIQKSKRPMEQRENGGKGKESQGRKIGQNLFICYKKRKKKKIRKK